MGIENRTKSKFQFTLGVVTELKAYRAMFAGPVCRMPDHNL